jgi:hypothetical protein
MNLFRWRTPKPLRGDSWLRGREADFDRLARDHQQLMERLNIVYLKARLRLNRRDRTACQQIITDAVDKALGEADPLVVADFLAAKAECAENFLQKPAKRRPYRRNRPRVTPLRSDALLKGALTKVWQEYPGPVGRLNKCHLEAQLYLRGRDLETCLEMIRGVLHVAAVARSADVEEMLTTEAGRAEDFLNQRAEQTARRVYATGLYLGVGISAAILTAVAFVAIVIIGDIPPDSTRALRDVLACLGGGAIGAVVSTILRVSNTDAIDYRVVMFRTAVFRIVLGWLFAAGLAFLIKGDVVTVFTVPEDAGVKSFFFWAAVGFLAGFNEVWARNLVTRTPPPPEQNTVAAPKGADKASA